MDKNKLLKIIAVIGILAGVAIVVLGFVTMDAYSGSWANTSTSFGGDFYTYSYQATAKAVNNVDNLGELMANAMGYLLIAIGLTDICFFGLKFVDLLPEKKETLPAMPEEGPAEF